ncbi:RimJ/RimL family protein N-acetyltransferase [Glutamicibacter mysorens]|uniref:RimJ/RimL family protein N-acetyltransferase n=1 Tax=Glutamicibacter mysorens TaxID=257984 RepID=A0ABX4N0W4_9MICC|nr:GNAT family protein [Glutamicibacter mysorens]PJJ45268.1 RimJ/RimL family protein N-acetyltransferase [Glutamicibacter mysorens]
MEDALKKISWPVRTERLSMRRVTPDDVEAIWRYRQLAEVTQWITAGPGTLEDFRAMFIAKDYPLKDLAVELDTGQGTELIGTVMLDIVDGWGQSEVEHSAKGVEGNLGWSFDPAYGGKGYATEAVRAAIGLCFGPLGLRRVTAECFAANEPSWKLMERLGMRKEFHGRKDSLHRNGEWMDSMAYALLAEEWTDSTSC